MKTNDFDEHVPFLDGNGGGDDRPLGNYTQILMSVYVTELDQRIEKIEKYEGQQHKTQQVIADFVDPTGDEVPAIVHL